MSVPSGRDPWLFHYTKREIGRNCILQEADLDVADIFIHVYRFVDILGAFFRPIYF